MRDDVVYQEYSADREYRFVVHRRPAFYAVQVQCRITDAYMGPDWFDYHDRSDGIHCADTLERAIEIGKECLACLL